MTEYNSHFNHHYHLQANALKRTTFAEALSKRNVEAFRQMCELLLAQVGKKHRKECNEFISIIDASPIVLKAHGFDWAKESACNRIQGLKLHIVLDGASNTPTYANITYANVNDITDTKQHIALEKV